MTCEPGHTQQSEYSVLHPHTFFSESLAWERFALDVLLGLSSEPKFIPSKYFYDDEGSRIFCEIMDLEEYYPTRCEAEILRCHGPVGPGGKAQRIPPIPVSAEGGICYCFPYDQDLIKLLAR